MPGRFSSKSFTLAQLALNVRLGGDASAAAVVDLLFSNVTGHAPNAAESAPFVELLTSHQVSAGGLALAAANTAAHAQQIDLVGLAAHGLGYAV